MRRSTDEGRRRLLRLIGASAALGTVVATGCLGGDGDPEEPEEEPDEDPDDDPDDEPEEVALDEPTEFPDDADCLVCNMVPAEFPDWNAQVVHQDGGRGYFCSAGCMVTYHEYPDVFAETDADIVGSWVSEFGGAALIDGFEAQYALETDSERVDDVMMLNPAPFGNREDAVAYVDEVDHLGEDNIVTLDAFDTDTADIYRGNLVEDADEHDH